MDKLQQQHKDAIDDNIEIITDNWGHYGSTKGKDIAASACSEITREHMKGFAEWLQENGYTYSTVHNAWHKYEETRISNTISWLELPQLIELYLNSIK